MEQKEFEVEDAKERFFDELLNDEDADIREFGTLLMAVNMTYDMVSKSKGKV